MDNEFYNDLETSLNQALAIAKGELQPSRELMIDIDKIDIANHEFTGEELGELLLASIKQMKKGEIAKW